jgi:SAM-dependent methyltransferase
MQGCVELRNTHKLLGISADTTGQKFKTACLQVLCSVPNVESALAEVKRVLKPGGKFLFTEHVLAPEPDRKLRLLQHILNPLQQATADGCHLDRDTLKSIQSAGFANVDASSFVVPGLGLIGPHVAGIATVN